MFVLTEAFGVFDAEGLAALVRPLLHGAEIIVHAVLAASMSRFLAKKGSMLTPKSGRMGALSRSVPSTESM